MHEEVFVKKKILERGEGGEKEKEKEEEEEEEEEVQEEAEKVFVEKVERAISLL